MLECDISGYSSECHLVGIDQSDELVGFLSSKQPAATHIQEDT